jgi:type IV secretion system protein VirB8
MNADERVVDAYYAEARSWETDRVVNAERVARRAWWVAGAGWIAAIASSIAILGLTPLKRVEPFVIRVDSTSGVVDVVPTQNEGANTTETVTRYLLTHYTQVCERFNFATAESDYEECGAFNSAQRNQQLSALWNTGNPSSPLNHYKDGTVIRAQVQAVSFFTRANGLKDLAQIRYLKIERPGGEGAEKPTQWIATVQYAYGESSSDPRRRLLNPLGFRILEFRSEPEVLTPAAPIAASTTPVANTGTAP